MQKRLFTVLVCVLAFSLSGFAQPKKSAAKKPAPAAGSPDKAYMQKIWDGWGTLDASHQKQFYAQGDHAFFDVAPLKYASWEEYEKGVSGLLKSYKSMKFTVADDAQIHQHGDLVWATATVKEDAVTSAGKHEMATLRWTAVWEKQEGKWLIVHEHVSEPLP
jgi:ketosteroid isomerase-like protein